MSQTTTPRPLRRYVRVRGRSDRFVEFDFAIENPELFVELILPPQAFETFCKRNDVLFMTEEQARQVDIEMDKWRYSVSQ
jgi:phenol/toluene 2-monooxygenase (NADH) P0/A0